MAWVEGITTSAAILRDFARILTTTNKLPDDVTPDPAKNWQLVYPSPYDYGATTDVSDERHPVAPEIKLDHEHISDQMPITVRLLISDGQGGFLDPIELIRDTDYLINLAEGKITLLQTTNPGDMISVDYSYSTPDEEKALQAVDDRVVLKTKTTPVATPEDPIYYGGGDPVDSIEVYLEMRRPRNLVNPESNTTDYVDANGILRGTDVNRHYIQMRIFDKWDENTKAPALDAIVSEWAKLVWLRDFQERLSTDPGAPTTNSRPIFVQTQIAINLEEMPVHFWLRCDNDVVTGVVSGEQSVDIDNALISFFYIGRIDPIENDQVDAIGNFALISSSSTLPTLAAAAPTSKPTLEMVEVIDGQQSIPGSYGPTYVCSYLTQEGESACSNPVSLNLGSGNDRRKAVTLRFGNIPPDAIGVRIYRNTDETVVTRNTSRFYGVLALLEPDTEVEFALGTQSVTGQWTIKAEKEYRNTSSGATTYGPEITLSQDDYRIEGNNLYINSNILMNLPNHAGGTSYVETGRYRVSVTADVYNSSVRWGQGSRWRLIFEATDITTDYFTDTGVAGSTIAYPYITPRPVPGVVRDSQGRIISVRYSNRWGPNTATGVTDICMLRTKTGVPLQRHYPSFVTGAKTLRITGLNPSRWTEKVHLSPVYVMHPFDGYRGKLRDVLVVPRKNLVHLDELIVDKDLPTQKTYKLFRINAPYSIFATSAMPFMGVAIRKD